MLSETEAGFRRILSSYKARAKKRNLAWELEDFDVRILLTSACSYCGRTSQRTYNRSGPTIDTDYGDLFAANGIDRVDNSLGYTKANAVAACSRCNYSKGTMTQWEFRSFIRDVYQHLCLGA